MGFKKVQWLFPLAVTLHNAEEAIWMPGWAARHFPDLPLHLPSAMKIRVLLVLLTAGAFVVTDLSSRKGPDSVWAYLLFGSIVTMLLNVVVPHVPAALVARQYAPGIVTAVAINLPLMTYLAWLAVLDRWVTGMKAVAFGVGVPLVLGATIASFFAFSG